jgi:hypothetical protein
MTRHHDPNQPTLGLGVPEDSVVGLNSLQVRVANAAFRCLGEDLTPTFLSGTDGDNSRMYLGRPVPGAEVAVSFGIDHSLPGVYVVDTGTPSSDARNQHAVWVKEVIFEPSKPPTIPQAIKNARAYEAKYPHIR